MSISRLKSKWLLLSLIIISMIFFLSCSDHNSTTNQSASVYIIGKIDPTKTTELSGSPIKDITKVQLVLTRMNPNGSIDRISHNVVSPDGAGNFILKTDSTNFEYAIVVANMNGQIWKTVVEKSWNPGDSIHIAPITDETTVETDVFNRINMNKGDRSPDFQTVQNAIDAELARTIRGNAVKIASLAEAIEAHYSSGRNETSSTLPIKDASLVMNTTPQFYAQTHGNIDLNNDSEQILEDLIHALNDSRRVVHLSLQVEKHQDTTTSQETIKGGLNSEQNRLWEQLKNEVVNFIKTDKQPEISFEIRLQIHA